MTVKTIDWSLWLNLATALAGAVARSEGKDERAVRYLGVAAEIGNSVHATNDDLAELQAKYDAEVANDTPTTASELGSIADRIKARSEQIQQT